jgi:acetolactate synthase-1/2/3 large subunit
MGVKLSGSKTKFQQFINSTNIPTLLSWSGIDLLPTQHKSHFGRFGLYGQRCANFIVQNSDLVIVLGSRLALPQVGYDFSQFARNAKIIVVDIDENELYKHNRTVKINHDCGIILDVLLEKLHRLQLNQINTWVDRCDKYRKDYPILSEDYKNDDYVNSYSFINKLTANLAENEIIVTDMGTGLLSGHQACDLKENQTMFTSQGLGEMGVGLPLAIGAAFAEPTKPITCLNCFEFFVSKIVSNLIYYKFLEIRTIKFIQILLIILWIYWATNYSFCNMVCGKCESHAKSEASKTTK